MLNPKSGFQLAVKGGQCSCDPKTMQCICQLPELGNVTTLAPMAAAILEHIGAVESNYGPLPDSKSFVSFHPKMGNVSKDESPVPSTGIFPHLDYLKTTFKIHDQYGNTADLDFQREQHSFGRTFEKLFVIIPGYAATTSDSEYDELKNFMMRRYRTSDVAVLQVDYNRAGQWRECPKFEGEPCIYAPQAVNTITNGRVLAILLNNLVDSLAVKQEDVHIIGFDMGAHVGRVAGKWFTKMNETFDGFHRHLGRLTGKLLTTIQ